MKYTFLAGLLASFSLPFYAQMSADPGNDTHTFTIADFEQFAWGFVEPKYIFGMTSTIFLANNLDSDEQLKRFFYSPDRRGAITCIEDRNRNFGSNLTLRLKGTF